MTLRSRLLLHYGAIIMGLIAIGVFTDHQLDTVNGKKRALQEEWEELDRSLVIAAHARDAIWALQDGRSEDATLSVQALREMLAALTEYQGEQESELAPPFSEREIIALERLGRGVEELEVMMGQPPDRERLREAQRQIETAIGEFHAIAETEMSEAISQIHDTEGLLDTLMWIWFIALAIGLVAGALTLRSRVTRPLRALREGAAALRGRDFGHRVAVPHPDEIGEVAEAFNAMSGELGDLYSSLEDKVAAQAEEIQRSMAELERTTRLATIGTLAAGVAHEINNPLEAISIRTGGMQRRAETDDMREGLDLIAAEVARCREITRRLLDFARQRGQSQTRGRIEDVDLGHLLRDAVELVAMRGGGQEITLDLPSNGPTVAGDATALRQVFINLLMNAADAVEDGGEIRIRAATTGECAIVEVCDSGDGIDPADLPHLFDPFYTTKAGKGTGLGLSVSHGIILDHGGMIEMLSDGPGRGATARVTLPTERANTNG